VDYFCANFSLLGLSLLDLGPMYATDVRQHHRSISPPFRGGGKRKVKMSIIAPQRQLVAPIYVKFHMAKGHLDPLGRTKFHFSRCTGRG